MRSSSGQHFAGLDHLRALAAFLVIAWHFIPGDLYAPDHAPAFAPLSLLTEGHTGVALFMVLSGYLFAKLLEGRDLMFAPFLRNRALRLAPLLLCLFAYVIARRVSHGEAFVVVVTDLARGFVLPTWPNGGWSIAVEVHFYMLLPLLLSAGRRSPWILAGIVAAALALRLGIHFAHGDVQDAAYWTLAGRIDQFVAGMLAWRFRSAFDGRRVLCVFVAFLAGWHAFDLAGGFHGTRDSLAWVFIPTAEGLAWGSLVAWYDARPASTSMWSRVAAWYGDVSFSVYLLHFFWVFDAAGDMAAWGIPTGNPYAAGVAAFAFFLAMGVPAWITNRAIERPFMRWRRPYAKPAGDRSPRSPAGVPTP